jgi:hypothetical protein
VGEPVDPRSLVVRFKPDKPASVLEKVVQEFRRSGHPGVSVWVSAVRNAESQQDALDRILRASELGGIKAKTNRRYYLCAKAAQLLDGGFTFHKDGYACEPAEHFTVRLGNTPKLSSVNRFLSYFVEVTR